jgi:hypothetical protein
MEAIFCEVCESHSSDRTQSVLFWVSWVNMGVLSLKKTLSSFETVFFSSRILQATEQTYRCWSLINS